MSQRSFTVQITLLWDYRSEQYTLRYQQHEGSNVLRRAIYRTKSKRKKKRLSVICITYVWSKVCCFVVVFFGGGGGRQQHINSHLYQHNLIALNAKQLLCLITWKEKTLYVARYLNIEHIFHQIIFLSSYIFLKAITSSKDNFRVHVCLQFFFNLFIYLFLEKSNCFKYYKVIFGFPVTLTFIVKNFYS